jgi:hypothetical protein
MDDNIAKRVAAEGEESTSSDEGKWSSMLMGKAKRVAKYSTKIVCYLMPCLHASTKLHKSFFLYLFRPLLDLQSFRCCDTVDASHHSIIALTEVSFLHQRPQRKVVLCIKTVIRAVAKENG